MTSPIPPTSGMQSQMNCPLAVDDFPRRIIIDSDPGAGSEKSTPRDSFVVLNSTVSHAFNNSARSTVNSELNDDGMTSRYLGKHPSNSIPRIENAFSHSKTNSGRFEQQYRTPVSESRSMWDSFNCSVSHVSNCFGVRLSGTVSGKRE